jgi:hypothetical protein
MVLLFVQRASEKKLKINLLLHIFLFKNYYYYHYHHHHHHYHHHHHHQTLFFEDFNFSVPSINCTYVKLLQYGTQVFMVIVTLIANLHALGFIYKTYS